MTARHTRAIRRSVRPLAAPLALAGLAAAVVVAPALAGAAPHAKPTAAEVQKKLGALAVKNTQLVETYNQARIATAKAQKTAAAAKVTATSVSESYAVARKQYVTLIQAQYEGSTLGAAGALLESDSDSDYMARVDSLGMMSTHVSQVVDRIDASRTKAEKAVASATKLYATAKTKSDALAKERTQVTAQMSKYRTMLQQLNSQQRSDYLRSQNPSVSVSGKHFPQAPSAAAQRAVAFALKQLGKPYVFGAAGPSSYDCSGLTMAAWNAGGVSLPHSAADQYNYGTHVSMDDLTPGDLIFMYQPIGHVTIYIGDGYMVSAPTEGEDVTVVPVSAFSGDIVGATHLA